MVLTNQITRARNPADKKQAHNFPPSLTSHVFKGLEQYQKLFPRLKGCKLTKQGDVSFKDTATCAHTFCSLPDRIKIARICHRVSNVDWFVCAILCACSRLIHFWRLHCLVCVETWIRVINCVKEKSIRV